MSFMEKYSQWIQNASADADLIAELKSISGDEKEIEERFYRELEFGTGGLRGILGAGTNRMNVYTVGKATQGLADYLNSVVASPKVAIAYDSRIKSDVFAKKAAEVFAANGIHVYIYPELMPTPAVSFAIRRLSCDSGIIVTASHNPSKYNGYKAYGSDGCQLGLEESTTVLENINKIDPFTGVKTISFEAALNSGTIEYITSEIVDDYLDNVAAQQMNPGICKGAGLKVVYTPLHGAGNKPVRAILSRIGIEDVHVVPEQEHPDGNFPTAPYPNPEIREAFECALKLAEKVKPDLLLATDPDSDRVGIAVKNGDDYTLVSGNDVGALLLNYVITQRVQKGTMPANPIAVKTIVTTELCAAICKKYNVELINVLTGFKFIGEQIGLLEEKGEESRYIFGFEESYGYLAGTYVRDKDAVVASMLICEMAAYYKGQGKSLLEVLDGLYHEFGMYLNTQKSFTCEGMTGMQQMQNIMGALRSAPPKSIAGITVLAMEDYASGIAESFESGEKSPITLPKSNVISFHLEGQNTVIVRPSGTEPKIKIYIGSYGKTKEESGKTASAIADDMTKIMGF